MELKCRAKAPVYQLKVKGHKGRRKVTCTVFMSVDNIHEILLILEIFYTHTHTILMPFMS